MVDLHLGDCLSVLPTIADASIDAIITDPIYPEIDREYGRISEAEWHAMMDSVVEQARRVLKPTGSAVFVLQPNSEKVGRMRPWLWKFMARWSEDWNMVQDAWWWNISALPVGGCNSEGLLRPSLKACVWLGSPGCYRNQDEVLDRAAKAWMKRKWDQTRPDEAVEFPSGRTVNRAKCLEAASRRGGTTPFNVLPMGNGSRYDMAGMHGHGAGTPINLCDWWTRYICPPGGTLCDPFMGSGTTGLSALKYGCSYVGIEKMAKYYAMAERRIKAAEPEAPLHAACR